MSTRALLASPLRHLDLESLNDLARQETRSREASLPPVSVFRWWARRTSAINREVIAATAKDLQKRLLVADPFAGGGVIPLAAIAEGHRIYAQDIDPWAASGIHSMLTLPGEEELTELGSKVHSRVQQLLDVAYGNHATGSSVIHTLRVMTHRCVGCGEELRLFPYAMVTRLQRREREGHEAFLACPAGHLFRGDHSEMHTCAECGRSTDPSAEYLRGRIVNCYECGRNPSLAEALADNMTWTVALVERLDGGDRVLAFPTMDEIQRAEAAWGAQYVDLGSIPDGKETKVLRRHGFTRWTDLYPPRQLAVTTKILQVIDELEASPRALNAMRLLVIGTTEMAGYASRWDRWYLKSYELMARHRFAVTTLAVEPHVWGVEGHGRGTVQRRLRAFARASSWLGAKQLAPGRVDKRALSNGHRNSGFGRFDAVVVQGSSTRMLLPSGRIDLILTDPPYHDDIQYSELSELFRAWFGLPTGPTPGSVVAQGVGQSVEYENLLHDVFEECHRVLRPDGHMVITFANRELSAWEALISALDRAGFRACGYAVVHGENESDYAKQNGTHYTHNLLIDLVKRQNAVREGSWLPPGDTSGELQFLQQVGGIMLRLGSLASGWREDLSRSAELLDIS